MIDHVILNIQMENPKSSPFSRHLSLSTVVVFHEHPPILFFLDNVSDTFQKPVPPLITLFEGNRTFYALMFLRACMETDLLSSAILSLGISAQYYQIEHLPSHLLPQTLLFHGHNIAIQYIM